MGATTPIEEYEGVSAIPNIPTAMTIRVHTKVDLRPILSPKCPKRKAAKGLEKYMSAKVEMEKTIAAIGSSLGKKTIGQTAAAAVPAIKKSYHSISDPIEAAIATLES